MSLAVVALGLLAVQAFPRSAPAFDRHLRTLRAERTERLRELYANADEELRAVAEQALEQARSPGAARGARPSLGAIDATVRRLEGLSPDDALVAFADTLDLLPVPGAFEARGALDPTVDERGTSIAVRVYPIYHTSPPAEAIATLWWVGPNGERVRARREPVNAEAFRRPGFDLFVRSPSGAAEGEWSLVLELEDTDTGATARCRPVAVAAVADLGKRVEQLAQAPRAADIVLRVETGLRDPVGQPLAQMLEHAKGQGPLPLLAEAPALPDSPALRVSGSLPWGWFQPAPVGASASAVWVLASPSEEAPGEVFRSGCDWRGEAERAGAALLAARVGLEPGTRPSDAVAAARKLAPGAPAVLVLRGDSIARLRFALFAGDRLDVDGLVLCGDEVSAEGLGVTAPTLIVRSNAPGVAGSLTSPGSSVQVERRGASAFLGEAQLPAIVREWVAEHVSSNSDG